MPDHDDLIDALCAEAVPIQRVQPASVRALYLIPLMLVLGFAATTILHRAAGGWSMPANPIGMMNAGLSLLLGATGLVQALAISIPGGTIRIKGGMMAAFAVWIALAATSIGASTAGAGPVERQFCFAFLLVAGLPMMAVTIFALRSTRSLNPVQSLVAGGFGIAFLSFGLLAFCHPVDLSIADFATHLMAALVLGLLTVALGRKTVAI